MNRQLRAQASRLAKVSAVALFIALARCVDQPTATRTGDLSAPEAVGPSLASTVVADQVTQTLLTAGNDPVNQAVYTTAPISPAPNTLITVAVMGHNSTAAVPSPIITGGGMTAWDEVVSVTYDSLSVPLKRMTVYRAMSATPGSGPITIKFSKTQSNAQWIVSQWSGVDVSGVNGAGAIVQSASARADLVTGLTVTLAPLAAGDVALGVFGVRKNALAITPGAGFTEIAEQPSLESTNATLETEWALGDNTVDATWAKLNGAALAVEIRRGGPVDPPPPPPPPPAVSASLSTVTASPSPITTGTATSTVTVTVKDAAGTPISGANVFLTANGTGNTLTEPSVPTDASGVATGTISSTDAGTKVISATANGIAITQTASVEFTAPVTPPVDPPTETHPVTETLLTSGNDVINQSVYTTAPISPAPNTLITVAVMGHNATAAVPSPIITGGGMTSWDEVATVTFDAASGIALKRMTIYRAMSATPGSGPITIKFSKTQSNAQWIVSQWEGVDVTGVNGAGAIAQTGSGRADATSNITVNLAAFSDGNDASYGVFGARKNAMAINPGAGFTEIAEQPSLESTNATLQAEWASNDNTVDASWANLNGGALAVEIRAGSHGGGVVPVVSVDVSPTTANILVGGKVQLTATPQNAEGEALTGRSVNWASSAPSIALVSTTGLVTGVADGSATITATSEGKTGTSIVTVATSVVPVSSVDVTPTTGSVTVGGTLGLTATARDANGQPLANRAFTWTTDAPLVARVSSTGVVSGVGEGSANITATSEGKSATAAVTVTSAGAAAIVGQWSSVIPAPMVLVHVHLLIDGRVLVFGKGGVPQVFNPATGGFTAVPAPSLLFCAGHDWLPDGRLLVAGGHIAPSRGLANTNIFDFNTNSWIAGPAMAQGRWYPTNTTLPNGEMITLSGEDANGVTVPLPEIWNGSSWRQLTTASLALANYPRAFVAPDGRIFVAGSDRITHFLDVTGTGRWTDGPPRVFGGRSYGAAVMYEPGKILYTGGSNPPTNTAEIIDLNAPNPQWSYTGSMTTARWNHNATLLPTGEVLITAGVSGDRSNPANAVNTTEIWSPVTGRFTTLSNSASLLRGYHSTSLLLPDGRVLHAGGGDGASTPDNLNYELYSPPYLFKGARPVVTGTTPGTVTYGQSVFMETADGASIAKVTMIRNGSVTHAFDAGGRLIPLNFARVNGGISISIPTSGNTAPPGPYMVFLVNSNGVPSIARLMLVR